MVKTLNEEGFTAPEGGQWVLSQLQKVLDRIRLNRIASQCESFLEECQNQLFSSTQIIEALHQKGIPGLKRSAWDIEQLKKLSVRIQQIKEMTLINQFLIDLLPLLRKNAPKTGWASREQLMECVQAPVVQKNLQAFPEGMNTLNTALESAVKHLSIYLKIVKTHLEQLAKVLELKTHHHTTLDRVDFPKPLRQVMQLFQNLDLNDLAQLENLALESLSWTERTQVATQTL